MLFHQPHNCIMGHTYNAYIYKNGKSWHHHFHQNPEVIYIFSGEIFCEIGGKECLLHPDDFALCLPEEIHCIHPQPNAAKSPILSIHKKKSSEHSSDDFFL